MPTIYPSLIACNLLHVSEEIKRLEPYCQGFHLDVMDNHFVPNLGMSLDLVNEIAEITDRQLWVHLMVERPEDYIDKLYLPDASIVTFHLEATSKDAYLAKRLREKNWLPGIAIKPKTNVEEVFPFLNDLHQVCIMSVEPGFYGQDFLKDTQSKIEPLVGYRQTSQLTYLIAIDGGVGLSNIKMLAEKGIDDFGIGSAIFKQPDPVRALQQLQKLIGRVKK